MANRAPIHLGPRDGSAEPVVLLHPFLLSQTVWDGVAPQLADRGNEVFAPTMAGHHGGPRPRTWFLSSALLADHVEEQMDALGWKTAHIVGNSLGGWVAFELKRRGRARSVTGIAPAGGWTRWSVVKFEVIAKFLIGLPVIALAALLGRRVLALPFSRQLSTYAVSATPDKLSDAQIESCIDDVAHCPAYYQLLGKALLLHGLQELSQQDVPTQLVMCEKDRVIPSPRFTRHFVEQLPPGYQVTMLDGVGHVPMFEAPGRVAEVIADFLDRQRTDPPISHPAAG